MLSIKIGDIFDNLKEYQVLVHGCNIYNAMGNGIALTIKQTFPEVYELDKRTIKGDYSKLGTIQYVYVNPDLFIVNAYTQITYWDPKKLLCYDAVRSCMKHIKIKFTGKKICMPKIGAGLARGNWDKIYEIIKEELFDEDVTVFSLK